MQSKKQIYRGKQAQYYQKVRHDIISVIPGKNHKILEIGCGSGKTLLALKNAGKASEIVGVDIYESAAPLDNFIVADIENLELPYPENYFDIIICGDVLEHLVDPWQVLRKLRYYLKPDGWVVASIPNFRQIYNFISIFLKGDFRYTEEGLLDRTHLRFFCKKNMRDLFDSAGLSVQSIHYFLDGKKKFFNRLTFGIFEELLVVQYILTGIKQTNK